MSLKNITTIFEDAVAVLPQVSPPLSFIHGSTALQNLLADKISVYPCVFLDSPRTGGVTVRKTGSMMIKYMIRYAVFDKTKLDDSADNIRETLQDMGAHAILLLSKVLTNFRLDDDVVAKWTELEGEFDAHLTGWMVEFEIEEPSTDYIVC